MNEILFELVKVVIMVAVLVITRYVIPWVRSASVRISWRWRRSGCGMRC